MTYRAQVFYGQTLRIEMAAGDVGARGCDLIYRVTDAKSGDLVGLAKTGIVFYDYERKMVVATPPSFAKLIEGN